MPAPSPSVGAGAPALSTVTIERVEGVPDGGRRSLAPELARDTLGSRWVLEEIRHAHDKRRPMIPVFQESYRPPDASKGKEPHVEMLLDSDGVHLLDERNIHVDHTIADLAQLIEQTVAGGAGRRSAGDGRELDR